jgi:hypothetical protein
MIVLAVAKVNEHYLWKSTYAKCIIEAVINDDKEIQFLEHFNGHTNVLTEAFVQTLFPMECVLRDRPFLIRDNVVFYTILHRDKKRNTEKFKEIMLQACSEKPVKKIKRTR